LLKSLLSGRSTMLLSSIFTHYLGHYQMSNKTFIYDIVEKFYITFKLLLEENLLP